MSVVSNNILAGASGQGGAGGYEIERSLRFNAPDSSYLSRTPSSEGNRKTWTYSFWIKSSGLTGYQYYLSANFGGSSQRAWLQMDNNASILTFIGYTASYNWNLSSRVVFRDPSAWYHILISFDTTQATASNRVKWYVNGEQLALDRYSQYPSLNHESIFNTTTPHKLSDPSYSFNGYLADVHFIDGQALAPTDFGETDDNGVWQPIEYAGTYGTNGFHLDFADNSSNAALGTDTSGNSNTWTVNNLSVGLGDYSISGGSNYLNREPADMFDGSTSTYWQAAASGDRYQLMTFATPKTGTTIELSVLASNGWDGFQINGTVPSSLPSAGSQSWYNITSHTSGSLSSIRIAYTSGAHAQVVYALRINGTIVTGQTQTDPSSNDSLVDSPTNGTQTDTGAGGTVVGNYATLNPLFNSSGTYTEGNLQLLTTAGNRHYQATLGLTSGKWYWEIEPDAGGSVGMIGIALGSKSPTANLNGDSAMSYYGVTGYKQGGNTSGVDTSYGATFTYGDIIGIALDLDSGTKTLTFYKNGVSQGVAFNPDVSLGAWFPAVSSGSSVNTTTFIANFGQRAFAYTAPSGYKSLNTANLPEPTIADGSKYFDTKLYTGNGGTNAQTGLKFSPDFLWFKVRSQAYNHNLFDSVRGNTKHISSNLTNAEYTESSGRGLTAFDSNGFTLGQDVQGPGSVNAFGDSYVGWAWDGGSSTVSNTDGSITSQVRANPSAGFSIVSYTGTGSNGTIGHGLGASPGMILIKGRTSTIDWPVFHSGLGSTVNDVIVLNQTAAKQTITNYWNGGVSSTVFGVLNGSWAHNTNGANYVAYCFAPVAGYSAMGSYVGNGSADGPFVHTGFKIAFLMLKCSSASSTNWIVMDAARDVDNVVQKMLLSNTSSAEVSIDRLDFLSNGFKLRSTAGSLNASGATFIYLAFASNPFKTARAR